MKEYKEYKTKVYQVKEGEITYTIHEHPTGTKSWRLNSKLHRVNGPAIEYPNGDKEWHFNGKLHRVDGPAIEYADGGKEWYRENLFHREDGPAIEYPDGTKGWFLNGEKLTEEKFQNMKALNDVY